MTPKLSHILLAAGLLIAGFGSLVGYQSCVQKRGNSAEHQANVFKGAANEHQTQAKVSDAVAEDLKAKLDASQKDLGRVMAERDAALRRMASLSRPGADPKGPNEPGNDPVVIDRAALIDQLGAANELVAKDAEVIKALQADSVVKDSLITVLTKSRDEWKATAELREKQAMAQEAATRAWKDAVVASKWRGRIEGFAVGIASGYVAGRLK